MKRIFRKSVALIICALLLVPYCLEAQNVTDAKGKKHCVKPKAVTMKRYILWIR